MKKKILALILAGVMALSVTGCGEAKKVTELIDAIGTVSDSSEEKIIAAEEAYAELTDKQKNKVQNYDVLSDARDAYDALILLEQKKEAYNAGIEAYEAAVTTYSSDDCENAVAFFEEADDYEDAADKRAEAQEYLDNLQNYSEFFKMAGDKKSDTSVDVIFERTVTTQSSSVSSSASSSSASGSASASSSISVSGSTTSSSTSTSSSSGTLKCDPCQMTVTCTVNEDKTVTLKGTLEYPYYDGEKISMDKGEFTFTGDKLPKKLKVNDKVMITYSKGKYTLKYATTNSSEEAGKTTTDTIESTVIYK